MQKLSKLQKGDKVAVLSPSFAAPGMFPAVYELGLHRLKEVFNLGPVEFLASSATRVQYLFSRPYSYLQKEILF